MRKLWQASQVLNGTSPFKLLDHTEAQLDFILENYVQDNPDKGMTFTRPGKEPEPRPSAVAAAWERVLVGKARDGMMSRLMPSEAVLKRIREQAKLFRPTVVRGPASQPKPNGK